MSITVVILGLASTIAFVELSGREREKLFIAKKNAATMVIDLLGMELAPAVDFGDPTDVSNRLDDVRANPDIVSAGVWSPDKRLASWSSADAPKLTTPVATEGDGAVWSADFLVVTKTVRGPKGDELGRVRLMFSLRPENEAFRRNRVELFWLTAGAATLAALFLGAMARLYVTGPVTRLARAASALARGDLSARVAVRSDDEIGELSRAFNSMGDAVAYRQRALQKEIELAQHIQTSILPRTLDVAGLEMACVMVPTSEVGGDYYDVQPIEDGAWLGIGDVAGHGLDAGLMMLMIQSIVASLVTWTPAAQPSQILCALNEVLFDNIRKRLGRHDHATLTLLHYERSGRVTFAGAHEDVLVFRAGTGKVTLVPTPGTWVGGRRDIRPGTVDSTLELERGDLVLLHTDGATEIRNSAGEEFGIDRLCAALEQLAERPVADVQSALLEKLRAWGDAEDDITLVALRYVG